MPWSGGFLTWPAFDYTRLRLARSIRAVLQSYEKADNPVTWTDENPEQFKVVVMIQKARDRVKNARNT